MNELGVTQASIDASGSAYFKNGLALDKYLDATTSATIIAASENFAKNGVYAPAIETKYETAGIGLLPENEQEIIIYNESIKENSLIYLTPTNSITNNQLSIISKESCLPVSTNSNQFQPISACRPYFKVSTGNTIHSQIKFNWLIIN